MKNALLMAGAALVAIGGIAQAQNSPTPDPATAGGGDGTSGGAAANPADTSSPTPEMDATTSAGAPADEALSTPDAGASAPTTEPAAQSAATMPSAPAADPAKATAADQMIEKDWAKYDSQNSGTLTALSFGQWIMAAQGNDMSAQVEKSRNSRSSGLPATKILNATSAEFSKADTDHDGKVSREELKTYLSA